MSRRRDLTRAVGWATINQRARLPRFAIFLSCGPVAQLGARFHGMEEVVGSIPTRSTKSFSKLARKHQPERGTTGEHSLSPAPSIIVMTLPWASRFNAETACV